MTMMMMMMKNENKARLTMNLGCGPHVLFRGVRRIHMNNVCLGKS
jgi:hypothetical protein